MIFTVPACLLNPGNGIVTMPALLLPPGVTLLTLMLITLIAAIIASAARWLLWPTGPARPRRGLSLSPRRNTHRGGLKVMRVPSRRALVRG